MNPPEGNRHRLLGYTVRQNKDSIKTQYKTAGGAGFYVSKLTNNCMNVMYSSHQRKSSYTRFPSLWDKLKKEAQWNKVLLWANLHLRFSTQEEAIVEKIGYPEMCVNKTLLEEYYKGVSIKRAEYNIVLVVCLSKLISQKRLLCNCFHFQHFLAWSGW